METRSELRKKIMTILYQIAVFDKNKIEYNVDELIKENPSIYSLTIGRKGYAFKLENVKKLERSIPAKSNIESL